MAVTIETRNRVLLRVAAAVGGLLALGMAVKIAWVSEDAYIVFRSVEQLFDGNGPRWNPHERVQVFTSPLWYGVLSAARVVSSNVFFNALAVSILCWALTLVVVRRALGSNAAFTLAAVALVVSNGFLDFTTSGLENPLAFLVVAFYLNAFLGLTRPTEDAEGRRLHLRNLFLWFGISLVVRHDLLVLLAIPTAFAVERYRRFVPGWRWLNWIIVATAPILVWSAFAIVYYGTPLPNPVYAKLWTGIAQTQLWRQGLWYVVETFRADAVTVVVLVAGTAILFASRRAPFVALGLGALANLLYVISVGGDFMVGRFFSTAFFLVVVALAALWCEKGLLAPRARAIVATSVMTAMAAYAFAFPHTPVNSSVPHTVKPPWPHGVADERGATGRASLWAWFHQGDALVFPDRSGSHDGWALRQSDICCSIQDAVGMFGYWAGTDKLILDLYALCDPLLARLPIGGRPWRIGHYRRALSPSYMESIHYGENRFEPGEMHDFYEVVRIVTQEEELFSRRRFKAILEFNKPR